MSSFGRDEILRRFETWLDTVLASEAPLAGIDAELLSSITSGESSGSEHDSYALWAAMTALTQEVKLQGRTFRELNDTIAAQPARIAEEVRNSARERERESQREIERRCRKEALATLIDLRDRMERGRESVRTSVAEFGRSTRGNAIANLFAGGLRKQAAESLEALAKGYELALDRLDQALGEWNAHEIRCRGEMFDPRLMNAVDREETASVPEGTVLAVYRSGYEWNGEILRTAQVKVSSASKLERNHE